ncbi:DUF4935 domain-containing protein [Cytobacillus oceanisediminis]|uniref:PIN domain-containing protein n=1 Tax=Cytobacillus oceanisediminis TaxID=665099 RepID=UPI001CCC351F|nr:PIN domain-containing protein [Cytobacillus oceanisediminis]MBZ9536671.1 DUF4935 domain-containing protein [Cytobacillus oceanisediminis]
MNYYDLISKLFLDKYYHFLDNKYSKRNRKSIVTKTDGELIRTEIKREKQIFLFLDTCIWINLANKGEFETLVKIADLHNQYDAVLLIPEQLTKEWDRNKKEKIVDSELNTLKDIINKTKNFRDKFIEDDDEKKKLDELITNAEELSLKQAEYVGNQTLAVIDSIQDMGFGIPTTDNIKLKVIDLSLNNRAPFHRNKNSAGDAILFLSLIDYLKSRKDAILYFITDNKSDFSQKDAPLKMHEDFVNIALEEEITIHYSLNLKDTLDKILEEVTDTQYVEEYMKKYDSVVPKCPKCQSELEKHLGKMDERGEKIFNKCTNPSCSFLEDTGKYEQDRINDIY